MKQTSKNRNPRFATRVGKALKLAAADARKTAKLHGTPIYFMRDGKIIVEHPK